MSSTRRVGEGERRKQNGWASAPEFDDLRGLSGSAVAFKTALIDDSATRELLFFLQALSLRDGGIARIADELMKTFPEQIGTPTMYKLGCKPGKKLTQQERDAIDQELHGEDNVWAILHDERRPEREHCQSTADEFLSECRELAENGLELFIERLCCDPKQLVGDDGYQRRAARALENADCENYASGFRLPSLRYFHNILGALFEYRKTHAAKVRENFVETSIGQEVFEALDYALETGRSALIEGNSGIGKTTALEAWCDMHAGQARLVKLKGITHRTGFFQELAKACGTPYGGGLSSCKVQTRVEQFLQRTKLVLVIDEGQYLFPPGNRVYTPPELINWLTTACYNEGIPFVISATAEFGKRRAIIEKNTTWQSEQLRRRIRRDFVLPEVPTKHDLMRVARKLLPDTMPAAAVEYVTGYALSSKGFFQAIRDAIEDAQLIARRDGRKEIKFADLKAAIVDWRSKTDAALKRVFQPFQERRGRRPQIVPVESVAGEDSTAENAPCKPLSETLNAEDRRTISLAAG